MNLQFSENLHILLCQTTQKINKIGFEEKKFVAF